MTMGSKTHKPNTKNVTVQIPPIDVVQADVLKVIREQIDRDIIGSVPHIVEMEDELARELAR